MEDVLTVSSYSSALLAVRGPGLEPGRQFKFGLNSAGGPLGIPRILAVSHTYLRPLRAPHGAKGSIPGTVGPPAARHGLYPTCGQIGLHTPDPFRLFGQCARWCRCCGKRT